MRNINLRYVRETFDENGLLKHLDIDCPDDFNFGYDIVDDIAVNDPQRLAMVWEHENGECRKFTFADIKRLSDKTCNYLSSKGIGKGDFVMLVLKHSYQFWFICVALHKMGAIAVPATFMLKPHDIEYRIDAAGLKAAIVTDDDDIVESFEGAGNIDKLACRFIVNGHRDGWLDFDREMEECSEVWERVPTKSTDRFLMYFTSGTSGNPKMAVHDYSYPLGHILLAKHWQQVEPDGLHWTVADTGWAKNAWGKFYGQWLLQGTLLVYDYDRFPPEQVLAFLAEAKATSIMAQPSVYRLLTQVGMDRYDLSSITNYAVGGEKLLPDLAQTVTQQTGHVLYEGYAQSEAGLIASASQVMGRKEGSVGKILPKYHVEILLVADGGRHPQGLMMGYLDDEEANRRLWDGDYFHTGDLATRDADGFLYYLGRSDGIIKTKGYRVSPVEIEEALSRHPAVAECLATGEPDPDLGQKVKVYVTLAPGYAPSPALREALMAFHNEACAGFKKIRDLAFVPALAHNANGKLIRGQFRDPKA